MLLSGLPCDSYVEIDQNDAAYPQALFRAAKPPERLYVIGDPLALQEGLAIVGARKATPYGAGCAHRFAAAAARNGVVVISGGARGCDAAAHRGAMEAGGKTVVFLGGGSDYVYPASHAGLFRRVLEAGGALVSEHPWGTHPQPWMFRARNRLIASLARATLIVEAGLPSGTFSTADEALAASRDVMVVPGAITAPSSRGANRLLVQGAVPIVDDESFEDALLMFFGCLKQQGHVKGDSSPAVERGARKDGECSGAREAGARRLVTAVSVEPLSMDALLVLAKKECNGQDPRSWLAQHLAEAEAAGLAARYPDGTWGPVG